MNSASHNQLDIFLYLLPRAGCGEKVEVAGFIIAREFTTQDETNLDYLLQYLLPDLCISQKQIEEWLDDITTRYDKSSNAELIRQFINSGRLLSDRVQFLASIYGLSSSDIHGY